MTSNHETINRQLARLSAIFNPPHPKTLPDGQVNPRYTAMLQVYLDALRPFQPWELEAGIKLALESHKFKTWPLPADLRTWCIQAQRELKPPPAPENTPRIEDRRAPISQDDRERIAFQLQVLRQYMGTLTKGETWRLTLGDCKAKALQRQANGNSRPPSQPS